VCTISIYALCAGEITLGVGTLVDVFTGGNVNELLIRTAGDDVSTNQTETLVTPDISTVL